MSTTPEPREASRASVIWICWLPHTRTSEICAALRIPLHTLLPPHPGWRKYPGLIRRTVQLLRRHRPEILIVPNPSLVLTLLCVLIRPVLGYRLIVDAHNEAVQPYLHNSAPFRWLARRLLALADLTIVTNRALADIVAATGGSPFVLPDRVPTPRFAARTQLSTRFNLVLIATFAEDEPYGEVFSAVRELGERLTLYVTGNPNKLGAEMRARLPDHIVFTGFLSEDAYWGLLASTDAIIDLTRMDNCLVCGAYEGVAVQRPLVLSDNAATRELFARGVVYTKNTSEEIRAAVATVLDTHRSMSAEILELKRRLEDDWDRRAVRLLAAMEALRPRRDAR